MEVPLDRLQLNQQYFFRYVPPLPPLQLPLIQIPSEGIGILVGKMGVDNAAIYTFRDINQPADIQNNNIVYAGINGASILHFYKYDTSNNSVDGAGTKRKYRRSKKSTRSRRSKRSKKTRRDRRSRRY
jgi:hypothetical protein